jgi:hypothetical protein
MKGDNIMAGRNTANNKAKANTPPVNTAPPTETNVTPNVPDDKQNFTPKVFDPNQIVTVKNGFQGRLVYKSRKTGERFVWEGFNSEQDMELAELKSARSSNKKYFINNWFMFDDPEIIEYLGMTQYYKFALKINEFDKLFEKSVAEIKSTVSKLSKGQKKSVAYRAKQMISTGDIDSNRTIAALEECLGVELVER